MPSKRTDPKMTTLRGNGHNVVHAASNPDGEQVLEVADFTPSGGRSFQGPTIVGIFDVGRCKRLCCKPIIYGVSVPYCL